jgi:hypothetical protein
LLVLDTCEYGSASLDLGEKWKSFGARFGKAQAHLTLVTSCRSRGEAFTGIFTPALAKALRNEEGRYGGLNQEHLFLRDVLRLDLPASQVASLASFPTTFNGEPDWDFPNPRFNSKVPLDLDLEALGHRVGSMRLQFSFTSGMRIRRRIPNHATNGYTALLPCG